VNAAARSASIGKRSATARSASVTTGSIFRDVGDFEADLIRSALDGETVWAEWDWQGALGERSVCEKANRRAGLLRQRQHAAVRRRCRRRTHQPDLRLQVSRAMDW